MTAPRHRTALFAIATTALLAVSAGAQGDVIKLAVGGVLHGRVWDRGAVDVTYNEYGTGIQKVTFGTLKVPAKNVKDVVVDPEPHRVFWRAEAALRDAADTTADAWFKLGVDAAAKKLPGLARHAWTEALAKDLNHAAARKELGSHLAATIGSDARLSPQLKQKLEAYLKLADVKARETAWKEVTDLGCPWPFAYAERAFRSNKEKKGRTDDRLLTFRSRENKGVYTVLVPDSYDPWTPTPLVIGLHGGGRGGKDGKAVVGSGPSAMNFYESGARRLGWIVICPTAIEAPWSAAPNDPFLLAVVEEACLLFNIDRNRIYLTGHSMGGFGTWHFGPKYAPLWAAISPMAGGGGSGGVKRLADTMTGVYLYHGANDPVVGVGDDQKTAKLMKDRGMDAVYAEIPDSGHGFPPEVEKEMWEFLALRRLAVTPDHSDKGTFRITEEPQSSFLDKVGKEEIAYFGPLGAPAAANEAAGALTPLLNDLRAGGGLAQKAAEKLGALKTPDAAAHVVGVLVAAGAKADTRRFACDALGLMGQAEAAKPLQKALADDDLTVVGAAAIALARLGLPDFGKPLSGCVKDIKVRFDKKLEGTRMTFPDFEAHLLCVTRLADAAALAKDKFTVPALNRIAQDFLFPKLDVESSERAGQDPAAPRRQLARALVEAYRASPDPAAKPVLITLRDRADLGVSEAVKELLATWG